MNTPTEVWAPVPGYEGWYDVSADGQVMRVKNVHGATPGKLLKPDVGKLGYCQVRLMKGRGVRTAKWHKVHRLVAAAFIGPAPIGLQVNHKDGNKANNALGNLEYVTPRQNILHAERTGLRPKVRGIDHPNSRLSPDEVRAIRRRRPTESLAQLAAEYGVSESHICRIDKRLVWAHLEDRA